MTEDFICAACRIRYVDRILAAQCESLH